jgi:murein DD-endopeptidase MepM/ murein hydrolase activator NlpD
MMAGLGECMRALAAALVLLCAPAVSFGGMASELHLEGELIQGGLVRGQVAPGSAVWLDDRELRVSPAGQFVFGFGRDARPRAELMVRHPDGKGDRRTLDVAPRTYQVQRIEGLPPRQVTPSEQDLARIEAEAALIEMAKSRNSADLGFTQEVKWPARGRISGFYGSQRILNGEPRAPHRGIDVAAPAGSPVAAMAAGVVSLAEPDLYFTGGTVVVDHGHGLHSIYAHMRQVLVEVGQSVARGAPLGTVGATGRATGPHLHWGVYWFDEALDPALLVGPKPDSLG